MTWWRLLIGRWRKWRSVTEEPFDFDFPDSTPPGFVDSDQFRFLPEIPADMPPPETQPTSPGALDSDPMRLE